MLDSVDDPIENLVKILEEMKDSPWRKNASCKGMNPDLFFGPSGVDSTKAKKVCARCTVKKDCLSYVVEMPETVDGIWGGVSGRQRRPLRGAWQASHGVEHSRKLTDEQVRAIRTAWDTGVSQAKLSRIYAISRSTIQSVIARQTYKHV